MSESAASRKSAVGMALSWAASVWTSANDFFRVSNQVPPAGNVVVAGNAISAGTYVDV